MGLATHMGIVLEVPTIGCAKTPLYGDFEQPARHKGAYTFIRDKNGVTLGAAVRTRNNVRCVYVSIGQRVSLRGAVQIILRCTPLFRIPQPLRIAHNVSKLRI